LVLNQWSYVVASRVSSTSKIFLNGVEVGSGSDSSNYTSATVLQIGQDPLNSAQKITGYITDARLVKGSGVTTVATPTAPLTAIAGTSVLLNATNSGIYDSTGKNDLITVGDARTSTAVIKYGSSSMYFDGTGDYLTAPPSSAFAFNGDYTVEAWVYPNSFTTTPAIFDTRSSGPSANGICVYFTTSGNIVGYINVAARITSATAYSTGLWYHVALVRSGTTNTLYVNGISVGIYTYGTALTDTWLTIGTVNDFRDATTTYKFNGYIDDLRVTKYARYTTTFTPPTAPFALQ
jgi:hypothetical protein